MQALPGTSEFCILILQNLKWIWVFLNFSLQNSDHSKLCFKKEVKKAQEIPYFEPKISIAICSVITWQHYVCIGIHLEYLRFFRAMWCGYCHFFCMCTTFSNYLCVVSYTTVEIHNCFAWQKFTFKKIVKCYVNLGRNDLNENETFRFCSVHGWYLAFICLFTLIAVEKSSICIMELLLPEFNCVQRTNKCN